MSTSYDNNSISSLSDEDQVRKKPAVIFGTNDINGCAHSIFEIVANSIDEIREGYGDMIELIVTDDNVVTVKDNGRGVPMDWNSNENKYNWELVFCQLYASGKYDSNSYSTSLGLNGLGATSTQYASEFMRVISKRDGKRYEMNFKKGRPVGDLKVEPNKTGETGTEITFKPDLEVFTDIDVKPEFYLDTIRRQAMLHPNTLFKIQYKDYDEIAFNYSGPKDFLNEALENQMLESAIQFEGEAIGYDEQGDNEEYKLTMGLSLTFTRDIFFVEMYHNGSFLKDANENATDIAFRNGIAKAIEELAKSSNKIGKSEKIQYKDIEEIVVAIGWTTSPGRLTWFKNQTKTAIGNPFIQKEYTNFVMNSIKRWATENKAKADKIVDEVLLNKKAREAAESVKKRVIRKLKSSIDSVGGLPEKFVECESKNPNEREIYIVEGDSAAGSCKQARDARFQAIMPVRGKILNCLKTDITKIFNNEIITDLIKIYGCGVEVHSKYIKDLPKFDIEKLNWSKIIFCTDADLDGMQIRCLLIAMIYRLMPSLLKEGRVFIAETPLFEIVYKGGTEFAYTMEEKDQIMAKLYNLGFTDKQIKINRSKGLGENDPEMMSISTMKPETRRLVKVEYKENDELLYDLINSIMGDDLEGRRALIDEYFSLTDSSVD